MRLSVSKVKTFAQCKAKYRFCYIEKLPKIDRAYLALGSFLHQVLEFFWLNIIANPDNLDYVSLLNEASKKSFKEWKHKLSEDNILQAKEILANYKDLFFSWVDNNKLPKVKSLEEEFLLDIGNDIIIKGCIDVVQIDADGTFHVIDYKSSKPTSIRFLKKDKLQLETYAFVKFLQDDSLQKIRGSYIMLAANCEIIKFEFNRNNTINNMTKYYNEVSEKILKEKLWRPNATVLCKYCDYSEFCKAGKEFIRQDITKYSTTKW